MAPHSSALAWKIPWTEELGGLQSMGSQLSNFTFTFHFPLSCIGEGNGNPLLPRESWDGGACWAAVYGVVQSQTRLKQLSSSRNTMKLKGSTSTSLQIMIIFWTAQYSYFIYQLLGKYKELNIVLLYFVGIKKAALKSPYNHKRIKVFLEMLWGLPVTLPSKQASIIDY